MVGVSSAYNSPESSSDLSASVVNFKLPKVINQEDWGR